MPAPSPARIVAALAALDDADRAVLEEAFRAGTREEHERTRSEKRRLRELVEGVAIEAGAITDEEVRGTPAALRELPGGAWPPRAEDIPPPEPGPPLVLLPRVGRGDLVAFAPRAGVALALALPGLLTLYLGFNAGGFFPGSTGVAAAVCAFALVVRVTVAERPLGDAGAPFAVLIGGLALFAVWTLISAGWSDAPERALVEFDRAFLYLLAALLVGIVATTPGRLRWVLRGLALAIAILCVAGFLTRVLPDVFSVARNFQNDRLSYPLTYWNAMGLIGALGIVLSLHLTSDAREPWPVRVLAAAAFPAIAAALLLSFSRGGIAVAVLGVAVYAVVGRPRALLTALVAVGPATAIALTTTYDADRIAEVDYTSAAAAAQGHHVARVVLACAVGAAALRAVGLLLDSRLMAIELPWRGPRARLVTVGVAFVVCLTVALAAGAPGYAERQYDRFVHVSVVRESADTRGRLSDTANNGRLDFWEVARDGWRDHRFAGNGAGTYELLWARDRPDTSTGVDGHSLYLEVLAELGVVGFLLILVVVLMPLGAAVGLARGPNRPLYAAVLASGLAWAVHAGVDWDWEMPAVTLPFVALAAAATTVARPIAWPVPGQRVRVVGGLAVLLLAITPIRLALSEGRQAEALKALIAGDCNTAIDRALDTNSVLGVRPEPYAILGFCDARRHESRLSIEMMQRAVKRDPDSWRYRYGLALVRGAARKDPRPAIGQALRLNPREPIVRAASRSFSTADPAQWEAGARAARLPYVGL